MDLKQDSIASPSGKRTVSDEPLPTESSGQAGEAAEPPHEKKALSKTERIRWVTLSGLAVFAFHVLSLWYRWLRPDPEFLQFTGDVTSLIAILSFLGLQTDPGRRVALRFDRSAAGKRLFGTPVRTATTVWILAAVAVCAAA